MCDDAKDPARAAAHLVDDVRVPVILGFHRSKEVADLAASLFNPRGVLALAANTATMLRTIPREPGGARLVWRTTISTDMINGAVAALLAGVVEPELRAAPGVLAPGEPLRLALPASPTRRGWAPRTAAVSALRFNGKSVAENGESFRQIVFGDAPDEAHLEQEVRRRRGGDRRLPAARRRRRHARRARPGRGARLARRRAVPAALPRVRLTSPRRARLRAAAPRGARAALRRGQRHHHRRMAKLVLRHNEVFASKVTADHASSARRTTPSTSPPTRWRPSASEPITGPALARAIPRLLPPGEPVDVGQAGIYQALAALGAGKSIDLAGRHHLARLRPGDGRRHGRLRHLLLRARAGRRRARGGGVGPGVPGADRQARGQPALPVRLGDRRAACRWPGGSSAAVELRAGPVRGPSSALPRPCQPWVSGLPEPSGPP